MEKNKIQTACLTIITIIALGAVLYLLRRIFLPFMISILISFMLSPMVMKLNKIGIPKALSIFVSILIIFGVLYLIGLFMYTSLQGFIRKSDDYINTYNLLLNQLQEKLPFSNDLLAGFSWSATAVKGIVSWYGSFMSILTQIVLIIFFLVFILTDEPFSFNKIKNAFGMKKSIQIIKIVKEITHQIGKYLTIKVLVSMVTGALVGGSLFVIGIDFSFMWGVLAFFFNFIPNIGSAIIMVITILMSLIQFLPEGEISPIIATIVMMPLIQVIMGNLIDPKLQSDQLDLSVVVILISLLFWGWIWGIAGMFIAVPLTESIKIICNSIDSLKPVSIMMGSGKSPKSRREKKL